MVDVTLAQWEQFIGFLRKEDDPKQFMQNLLSNWGAVQVLGRGKIDQATFQSVIREVVNPFADEKTEVRYFYPDGWKPTGVEEQLAVLQGFYPDLDGSHVVEIASGITVPDDADGLFVVPKPNSVAVKLGVENLYGEGYGQLLETTVLAHLASQRKFHNYRAGVLTQDRVRMRQSAADTIRKLEEEQTGDFMVFPAQTGKKWGGYSPRNARWDMERGTTEFPLPAWVVGHIVLTNPKRFEKNEHLFVDCPGDEYWFEGDAEFAYCLFLIFYDGQLRLYRRHLDGARDHCGSGSGFVR